MKKKRLLPLLVVLLTIIASSCKQNQDVIAFTQWATYMAPDGVRNDAEDYERRVLVGEGLLSHKKHQRYATRCEIVIGNGEGRKIRTGKVTKIDTTSSYLTHTDRIYLLDWKVDILHGEYSMWHDSIVQYKGKNVGKFELRMLDSLPVIEPIGILVAQASNTTLNLFPERERLDSLTFNDTLWRTSGFAVDRRWAGKGFSRLAISQERLDQSYKNYQVWGQTKKGILLSFDYVLDPLTNSLLLKPADRLAFSRDSANAPIFVKVRYLDVQTNTERDTTEEFCCFYVLVKPSPGPWIVKAEDLSIKVDSASRAYIVEFPIDKLPNMGKQDWMLFAKMYNGDADIGHAHHLERIEDKQVYRTTISQSDLFQDENLWFVHGTQTTDMQAFNSLIVTAEECD